MWDRYERGRRGIAALILGGLLLSTAGVALAKDAVLTFKPQKKPLHYKMEIQQEMTMQGMDVTMNQTGHVEVAFISKNEHGQAEMSVSFSNIEVSLMAGGNLVEQEPELEGKTLHVFVTPHGDVAKVEAKSYMSNDTGNMAENLVENFFAYFPEDQKKLKTGDTWTQKLYEPSKSDDTDVPELDGEVVYTLEDLGKKDGVQSAKILGIGTIQVNAMTPAGLFKGDAEGETEVRVAVDGGHVIQCKSSARIKGKVGESFDVDRVESFECKLLKD